MKRQLFHHEGQRQAGYGTKDNDQHLLLKHAPSEPSLPVRDESRFTAYLRSAKPETIASKGFISPIEK